jgi:hypothetical protein
MIWIVAIDRDFLAEWILFRPLEKSSVFDAVLRQPRCMGYGAQREVDLWAFVVRDKKKEKGKSLTENERQSSNGFVNKCHEIKKKSDDF